LLSVKVYKCELPESVKSVAFENSDGSMTVLLRKEESTWQSIRKERTEDTQSKLL